MTSLLLQLTALLSALGVSHAYPTKRGVASLEERYERIKSDMVALEALVDLGKAGGGDDDVQEDADDDVVAAFTSGKYTSCAEVKEADLCGHPAAQAGCKATCSDAVAATGTRPKTLQEFAS